MNKLESYMETCMREARSMVEDSMKQEAVMASRSLGMCSSMTFVCSEKDLHVHCTL